MELPLPPGQFPALIPELFLLRFQPLQQRANLRIGVVIHRCVQIQIIQRADDLPGQPVCQPQRQRRRTAQDQQHRPHIVQQQLQHGLPGIGKPEHRAVRQAFRCVDI